MNKVYGYCRISTRQQSIDRQIRNILTVYPMADIRQEAYTGTKLDGREVFEKLLRQVKQGDTIVFDSVSRMSRNATEGFKLYKELFNKGINLVFLKEGYINTDTYKQQLNANDKIQVADNDLNNTIIKGIRDYLLRLAERQIEIAFNQAEKEVQDLHQRTKEGIETARINGKQIGQRQGAKLHVKKSVIAKEQIMKYSKDFKGMLNDRECMKQIGIARNTYYKYKRELIEEQGNK